MVWEKHDHRWVLVVWENHDHRWVLVVWENHDHRWVLVVWENHIWERNYSNLGKKLFHFGNEIGKTQFVESFPQMLV